MFTEIGSIMCEIDQVELADARFCDDATAFDICVHGKSVADPAQSDWWRGEVSNNYGQGNFSTQTRKEITFKTLRKLGFEGNDISKLAEQLVGVKVPFNTKESTDKKGKTHINVSFIGTGGGVEPITAAVAKARMKALMAAKVEAPPPTPDPVKENEAPDDEDLPF